VTFDEINTALDGLHAYETGSVDSGIHDDALKEKVRTHIQSLEPIHHKILVVRLCNWRLSPEVLRQGYGPEDLKDFLVWLDEEMSCLITV